MNNKLVRKPYLYSFILFFYNPMVFVFFLSTFRHSCISILIRNFVCQYIFKSVLIIYIFLTCNMNLCLFIPSGTGYLYVFIN